ncbi:MAG: alpha/beta fold hydrolase [Acidimicrobiales bacterium]
MDDEFSLLEENATEVGLAWTGRPAVSRRDVDLPDGRVLSALVWGEGEPELVLLHGGAQNAHTWDTVALALARPLVALDLAGHGRSSWREDGRYTPTEMADDVAVALGVLAPRSPAVVGMSMGGITTIALAAHHAALVPRAVLVDVTPGVNAEKAAAIMAFVSGPPTFPSFQALLDRTVEHNPTRSLSSLRRGLLHNAEELPDGSWGWRHHLGRGGASGPREVDFAALWDDVSAITAPLMLVRGGASPVVDDEDVAELRRRQPDVRVEVVAGAGHSIQGDRPLELAALLQGFIP